MEKRTIEYIKKGLFLCVGEKTDGAVLFSAGEWLKYGVISETEYLEIADTIDKKNTEHKEEITEAEYNAIQEAERAKMTEEV